MKKTYITFLASILLFSVSCSEDFFDRYPTDKMQIQTYMTNDDEVEDVLMDAYYYMRTVSANVILINEIGTDIAYNRKTNNSIDHIALNECDWTDTFGISASLWQDCFYIINRCNSVLEHLDNVKDATKKTQFEGEAKFFRAYAYFNLVRLFGPVPLTTSTIAAYTDLYKYDREPVNNIYTLIKTDVATAITNLPEIYSPNDGRATRMAAYTLAGEVYMTLGDFGTAATNLKMVIDYSIDHPTKLGLESSVRSIYDSQNPIGKEIILAAQYNYGSTIVANGFMGSCICQVTTPAGQPSYTASNIGVSQGSGIMLMTWELFNKLKTDGGSRFTDLVYNGIFEGESVSVASSEVELTDGGMAKIPTTLKYYDFNNNVQNLTKCNSGNDNIIYRYADVLLMYAECLNETSTVAAAAPYINQVRTRAGLTNTTAATKADMASAIEDERLMELCFEGHRWFDLLRTNRLTTVMTAHFNHRTPGLSVMLQTHDNGMVVEDETSTTPTSTATWKWESSSTPILFPIPYAQAQLNSNWTQNEAYN